MKFRVGDRVKIKSPNMHADKTKVKGNTSIIKYAVVLDDTEYYIMVEDYDEHNMRWDGNRGYPYYVSEIELYEPLIIDDWESELNG